MLHAEGVATDMPASEAMYRFYFRFLETYDEYFVPPDYDGKFERYRWRVHGLGLPDKVLRKIYSENIIKIIPGLKELVPAETRLNHRVKRANIE